MCGINGLIQFENMFSELELKNRVHVMNDQIVHRGPDAEGLFADTRCALGMRRLSIIDLATGNQPIWNERHDMVIVFNGELYNFRKLREQLVKKGHSFYTSSDTEVVLHGFEEYGPQFLTQMEGMFAFAIYDCRKREWYIARDRIGEKPLYYHQGKGYFIFGSELKSLVASGLVPMEIDRTALSRYFQLTYIPAPLSIYENVYKLVPGHWLKIDSSGKCIFEQYWDLDRNIGHDYGLSFAESKKKLREALFQSVEQRMVSDVPIGAFLSGGFDSSIIVGIMSHLSSQPVNTFTIGFKEKQYDESALANLVAKKNKTNHHVLTMDWDYVLSDLDTVLDNIDEPFGDSSLLATYAVSKMARKYVKVVLTGDAGDELFAGYNKYLISYYGQKYERIPMFIRKGLIEPFVHKLPVNSPIYRKANKVISASGKNLFSQHKQMMMLGFKEEEMHHLTKDGFVDDMQFIKDQYDYLDASDQAKTQYVDMKTVLEGDMLTKVDRASMLASVETRVPMLDTNVIELAFSMPDEFKINDKQRKIILKDTFKDLLPDELFHASKHGFGVPVGEWMRTVLRDKLSFYCNKDYILSQGLFNPAMVSSTAEEHLQNRRNRTSELWTFLVFQNWFEKMKNVKTTVNGLLFQTHCGGQKQHDESCLSKDFNGQNPVSPED